MKISELDRRRAIKRMPEFQKDYEDYKNATMIDSSEIIRREIVMPLKMDGTSYILTPKLGPSAAGSGIS